MLPTSFWMCQLLAGSLFGAELSPVQPDVLNNVCHYTFDRQGDLDLDDQPDDWVRRKGVAFPHYVQAAIDNSMGEDDDSSLRFDANGAGVVYYSPLIPIDDLHTYFFTGAIRTHEMNHDAAMISVSFLNHRRQRVQRFLSKPVMGTHAEWVPVRLHSLLPQEDVRFVVIGCHLVVGTSDMRDIGGKVWFDNLALGHLPRMEVVSNFYRHFIDGNSPIQVDCKVSGLDPGHQYELDFGFHDLDDNLLAAKRFPLEENPELVDRNLTDYLEPLPVTWSIPTQPPGFYSTTAVLLRDEIPVASQETTLAIMSLVDHTRDTGEFGWSIAKPLGNRELSELPQVAVQAGINALKYPVWQSAESGESQSASRVAEIFGQLIAADVTPIALLSDPPAGIRRQFARNWHGANEAFSLSPEFWESSLEPVVARFSSSVRHWQLGGERDRSFLGSTTLPQTIRRVRQRIQRICLNAEIGIPWEWEGKEPDANVQFISLAISQPTSVERLTEMIANSDSDLFSRWVLLRLSQIPSATHDKQAADLARMMLAAKLGGVRKIFLDDVYNDEYGLLNSDGSPRRMFIPWRTMALQLQGATYLGEFHFPNGSQNAVFSRDGSAFIVIWNDKPVEERLFLGNVPLESDLWGRTNSLHRDPASGDSVIPVSATPKILVNCSDELARWRIAARYEIGKMPSAYGGHDDAILLTNTFSQGVSGELTLNLPRDWEAEPRHWTFALESGESIRLPTHLRLPPNVNLGEQATILSFRLTADRAYTFHVHRKYIVGLDDLQIQVIDRKLADGRLEIEQIITNLTEPPERLDFRCSLFIPNARRQKLQITKLGRGSDRKFYYLPDAADYHGQELWLRLEQDGGRRVLNYRWKVGKDW